jgi:HEAT repeat protein
MKDEKDTIPFSEVLDKIFNADPIPVHLLFNLSDMSAEDDKRFNQAWAEADDERKYVITRHLADMVEEAYFVDYSPIFKLGIEDAFPDVRVAALDGLWDSTDTSFVRPLIAMMQSDPDVDVRVAAAKALAHYVVLAEWGQIPLRVSQPIIEALLVVYEDDKTAVSIKRAALEALGSAAHPRVNTLIEEAYNANFEEMRISAVFAMGNTADDRWLQIVLSELESSDTEMQLEAIRAAGLLGRSDAIEPLTDLLEDHDSDIRAAVVVALGQIGGDGPQAILARMMDDPEHEDLHELIEETIEEMLLLGGEIDLIEYLEGENSLPYDPYLDEDEDDEEEL